MKKTVLLCALAVICAAGLRAQQPQVLDRELFFGDPEISGAQISPDGQYIAFLKPWNKTRNIWVKKATEPFEAARLLTADSKRPIPAFFWSRDSRYVLFVQDKAGDENFHVLWREPDGRRRLPARRPRAAIDLTKATGARVEIFRLPNSEPDAMLHWIERPRQGMARPVQSEHLDGRTHAAQKNTDRMTGWVFDRQRSAAPGGSHRPTWRYRDPAGGGRGIHANLSPAMCSSSARRRSFEKDNKRVYMSSNKGAREDLSELELFDRGNGEGRSGGTDPENRVDFEERDFLRCLPIN